MPTEIPGPIDRATAAEQRRRLAEAVDKMADAIATGELTPTIVELEALALLCDERHLPMKAARVRRWMATCGLQ